MDFNNPLSLQIISLGLMVATSQLISCKPESKLRRFGYLTATVAQAISLGIFITLNHQFMAIVAFMSLTGYARGIYNYFLINKID
jgi:hypothetical protein